MKSGNFNKENTFKPISRDEFNKDLRYSIEVFNNNIDKFVDERIAPFLSHQSLYDTMFDYDSMKFIKWFKDVKTGNHRLTLGEIKNRCIILLLWGRCFRYIAIMFAYKKDQSNIFCIKPNESILYRNSWSIGCDRNGIGPINICIDGETYSMNNNIKFIEYGVTMATKEYLKLFVKECPREWLDKEIEDIVKFASWDYCELKRYEYKNDYIEFINGRYK